MRSYKRYLAAMFVFAAVPACASSSGTTTHAAAEGSNRPVRGDRNLLRVADLSEAQKDLTVLQVLRQLRPHFLAGTGALTTGNTGLSVYQDNTRIGGAGVLNEILMRELVEVRYLTASEASGRYGLGHEGGVIAIKRRK